MIRPIKKRVGKAHYHSNGTFGRVSSPATANWGGELSKTETLQGATDSQLTGSALQGKLFNKAEIKKKKPNNGRYDLSFMEIKDKSIH